MNIRKVLLKISKLVGIQEALDAPEIKDKKLMRGNALLNNKKIFTLICVVITFAILTAINLVMRLLFDIGRIVRGTMSSAQLFLPTFRLMPFYIFGLFIAAGLCIYIRYKISTSFKDLNVGQKGHARFMQREEIADRFECVPEKSESFKGYGGAPVARDESGIYIDNSVVNNIVYAITRGGKTEGLVVPTIDIISRAEEKASMIIVDAKGTLTSTCVPTLQKRGVVCYIIDLLDMHKSNFYNPVTAIYVAYTNGEHDLVQELITDLAMILVEETGAKDRFWVDAPRALISALLYILVEKCANENTPQKANLYSVFVLLASLGGPSKKEKSKMDLFFETLPITHPGRLAYTTIEFSEGKTRSSLLSIAVSNLDAYRRDAIAKLTSKSDFDLCELAFGGRPVAFFLRVPFFNHSYDALVTAFINQAFYLNMRRAAIYNNGKCARRVRVVGDEIFNFPALPRLENMITVCLGTGWSFDFYAQSPVQVEEKHGEKVAKIVLENCATIYFLASPDKDTREKISELCGKITTENVTRSGERFSLNKSITESYDERPLIPAQELSEFKDGEMIVFPTMQRRNLRGDKVTPLPILNIGEYSLKYRYEYLQSEYNPDARIPYECLPLEVDAIARINLRDIGCTELGINDKTDAEDDCAPYGEETAVSADKAVEPLMGKVYSPAVLQIISRLLPSNVDMDIGGMTEKDFTNALEYFYQENDISTSDYLNIKKMIRREWK